MKLTHTLYASIAVLSGCVASAFAAEPAHPGRNLYVQHCANCHDAPGTRAPALSSLKQMSAQTLRFALTEGVMKQQGALVPRNELPQLISYLAAVDSDSDWLGAMLCKPEQRSVDLSAPVSFPSVGVDVRNSRRMSAGQAGLRSEDLAALELAWAIAFPNVAALRSAPVIVGSTMFYTPTSTGLLLALDTRTACVKWRYDAGGPLRSSVSFGALGDRRRQALVFGDARGFVHAIDPASGALIWKTEARHEAGGAVTGAPIMQGDRIVVPISASGVGAGADPKYECCTGHGDIVALDAASGKKLWTAHTMEDARYTGKVNALGVKLRGPSGAPIWSSPSIDAKRGLVYAGAGQATSLPATRTSDAILAVDLQTGEIKWSFQALANDVWHLGCPLDPKQTGPNCPSPDESVLKDYDFGAGAVLVRRPDGKDVILAGQKSGDVWALDPDANGAVLWRQTFGQGTPLGGVHWGLATDGERVFAAINDPHIPVFENYTPQPGMNAIEISTGKVLWRTPVSPDCSGERAKRFALCGERYGLSAAPLVIDRSVVAAGVDGRVYIFDAASGAVVWTYDTLREFDTLNGVAGRGGGVDSQSIFAGDGFVFIASGYGHFQQPAGNVLLAFRPRRSP